MSNDALDVRPLSGALGAELFGAELSKPLSNEVFAEIYQALLDHLVIFFRDQDLTPEQHQDFAARFFKLEAHPFVQSLEGIPEIVEIVKEADEFKNWGARSASSSPTPGDSMTCTAASLSGCRIGMGYIRLMR